MDEYPTREAQIVFVTYRNLRIAVSSLMREPDILVIYQSIHLLATVENGKQEVTTCYKSIGIVKMELESEKDVSEKKGKQYKAHVIYKHH